MDRKLLDDMIRSLMFYTAVACCNGRQRPFRHTRKETTYPVCGRLSLAHRKPLKSGFAGAAKWLGVNPQSLLMKLFQFEGFHCDPCSQSSHDWPLKTGIDKANDNK